MVVLFPVQGDVGVGTRCSVRTVGPGLPEAGVSEGWLGTGCSERVGQNSRHAGRAEGRRSQELCEAGQRGPLLGPVGSGQEGREACNIG